MGRHFYTLSTQEASDLMAHNGYTLEGIACHVFPLSQRVDPNKTTLIYRWYSGLNDDHLMTGNKAEDPTNDGYQQDFMKAGIAYRHDLAPQPPGTVPLRRFYSNNQATHFYTTDNGEVQAIEQAPGNDWAEEEAVGYVFDVNQFTLPAGVVPLYRLYKP